MRGALRIAPPSFFVTASLWQECRKDMPTRTFYEAVLVAQRHRKKNSGIASRYS